MISQLLILIAFLQLPYSGIQSDSVHIEQFYNRIEEQYPLVRKKDLQDEITRLRSRIAESGYYPDISFTGMASYQSDVTQVNFVSAGAEPPSFSKDHYQLKLDFSQPVYTGNRPGIQKMLQVTTGEREKRMLRVELHQIRGQVNETYFSVLLMQQQLKSIELLMKQLRDQLKTVRSRVRNGVLLPSQQYILEAELVKVHQDSIQAVSDIEAGYNVLSELTGIELAQNQRLVLPEFNRPLPPSNTVNRPEYEVFDQSQKLLSYQKDLSWTNKIPTISAFATGAYGRPGLNVFDDNLQPYFIVGLRLNWNFWDWSNANREMEALNLHKEQIEADKDAFTRQLQASLQRTRSNIRSIEQILVRDEEIITLREKVVNETKSQLANGIVTATEYVTELTKANQARLTHFLHRVQLVQKKIEYATKLGISWED